jgi:hypothetical protein
MWGVCGCLTSEFVDVAGTISAKEVLGSLRGTIKQLPTEDIKGPKDGLLEYEKDGVCSEVSFSMSDVNEYITSLSIGDQVCILQTYHHSRAFGIATFSIKSCFAQYFHQMMLATVSAIL